jgi:hypothetical protein
LCPFPWRGRSVPASGRPSSCCPVRPVARRPWRRAWGGCRGRVPLGSPCCAVRRRRCRRCPRGRRFPRCCWLRGRRGCRRALRRAWPFSLRVCRLRPGFPARSSCARRLVWVRRYRRCPRAARWSCRFLVVWRWPVCVPARAPWRAHRRGGWGGVRWRLGLFRFPRFLPRFPAVLPPGRRSRSAAVLFLAHWRAAYGRRRRLAAAGWRPRLVRLGARAGFTFLRLGACFSVVFCYNL